jgi:hypothetical protein
MMALAAGVVWTVVAAVLAYIVAAVSALALPMNWGSIGTMILIGAATFAGLEIVGFYVIAEVL